MRLLVVLLVLSSLIASGQNSCEFFLEGRVMDKTGNRLEGATITASNGTQAISDAKGKFKLNRLCKSITLTVQFLGYKSSVLNVSLPSGDVTVVLESEEVLLGGVTVEGTSVQRSVSQTTSVLEKSDLAELHGRPLGEQLKEIPGVNAIQTGPSIFKPVIHGLHSQRILILNNGIRQEGQQWGIEHAPEVDPFIASQIEVVKGAETVRYGADAIGGVIIINPPSLHEGMETGGEINTGYSSNNRMFTLAGMLEGGIGEHWSWRVQGSGRKGGDFHTPDYNMSNTGLEEFSFSAAAGVHHDTYGVEFYASTFNTSIGILRAAHTGNLTDFDQSIRSGKPWFIQPFTYDIVNPRQQINHHLLKTKAYKKLNEFTNVNFIYGGQFNMREEYDIRRGGRSNIPSISMNLMSHVMDLSLDHEKGKHSGSFGINGTFKFNRNDTEETGILPLIPDYEQTSFGAFILEKFKTGKLSAEAGLRGDFQHLLVKTFQGDDLLKPSFNFFYFSGSLGASYAFHPSARLLLHTGISSRPPHVAELYSQGLHHGTASIEEGLLRSGGITLTDQDLVRKEVSKKMVTTLQVTKTNWSIDASLHYNHISNYVYLKPSETRLTIRGYFPVFTYTQTTAMLTGADLSVRYAGIRNTTLSLRSSILYAADLDASSVLPFIPPAQIEPSVRLEKDLRKNLTKAFISVSIPFVFEQTRAPRVVYPLDLATDTRDEIFDFAPAPDGYALVNLRAGFDWNIHGRVVAFGFNVDNVFDVSYRNYMNRLRYFSDEIGRNMTVRISYQFLKH